MYIPGARRLFKGFVLGHGDNVEITCNKLDEDAYDEPGRI